MPILLFSLMRKVVLAFAILAYFAYPVLAGVSVQYEISPDILLPGDYADCLIKLTNTGTDDIEVYSVVIYGGGLSVEPKQFYSVGALPGGGSYTLPFSIKAENVGRYNVEVVVYTENETLTQNIMVVVDDNFPSLSVEGSLYLGEVNELKLVFSTPVELKDVRVEALFNASPKAVYLGTVSGKAEGVMKFLATGERPLQFKLSFYNGRNYHELVREVQPAYVKSRGVVLNISAAYTTSYIGDCISVTVEVSNLRRDDVYNVTVYAVSQLGTFSEAMKRIAKITSGESRTLEFTYSPRRSGTDSISFLVVFYDELGNRYEASGSTVVKTLDSLSLSLTNVEATVEGAEIRVSGDISNNGRSVAYNAYAIAICGKGRKDYFVGSID
ncbi:MAG: hypothetical protein DRN03_02635, partial [Thermoplasmata archaeon]